MKLKTSDRTYNARISLCNACPHFRKSLSQCKKCGCFMKIKAKIAFTRCPVGNWERENDLTKDQLSILKRLLNQIGTDKITHNDNIGVTKLYNEIFGMNKQASKCGSCVAQTIKELREVLAGYED